MYSFSHRKLILILYFRFFKKKISAPADFESANLSNIFKSQTFI